MISKKSVIYRFLCIWWVLIIMAPRNSGKKGLPDRVMWCVWCVSQGKDGPKHTRIEGLRYCTSGGVL